MPTVLTSPVTYSVALPFVILAAWVSLYQAICFRAWGIGYVREVAARTEQYWCPIRHARRLRHPHQRYKGFAAYGDPEAYGRGLLHLREALRK